MTCELAIKVDVDTLKGYLEGLPRILGVLGKRNIRASIFFSMGPDPSGKAAGFLRGVFAPGGRGLKALFSGALFKAPLIVESNPGVLRRAVDEGHDCGFRCWDFALWRSGGLPREEARAEFGWAMELFARVAGTAPEGCAAPGVSSGSLAAEDDLGLRYASDTRGEVPFFPRVGGTVFRTLQVPTTLPPLEEIWSSGMDVESAKDRYLDLLEPRTNVYTVRAEAEGVMSGVFERLLDCCAEGEIAFTTLRAVAARTGADAKVFDLAPAV
jgi:hypothetical protein